MNRKFQDVQWIFFDLGNTLIDDRAALRAYLRAISVQAWSCGLRVCPNQLERSLATRLATYSANPWEDALLESRGDRELIRDILRRVTYPVHLERPAADAKPLLSSLHEAGYQLGVIANQSPGTEDRLARFGLLSRLSICLSSSELGISKPDDRIFRLAEETAQVPAQFILMIGDRIDFDVRPARKRGWKTIRVAKGITRGQRVRVNLDRADISCSSLTRVSRALFDE